jgi:hypothetical protein
MTPTASVIGDMTEAPASHDADYLIFVLRPDFEHDKTGKKLRYFKIVQNALSLRKTLRNAIHDGRFLLY